MNVVNTYQLKPEKSLTASLTIQQRHIDIEQTEKTVSTILPFSGLPSCSPAHSHSHRCFLGISEISTVDACRLTNFFGKSFREPDLVPIFIEEDDPSRC